MALLKIHNDLLKQDPELLSFIEKEFQHVTGITTVQDVINNFQAYLIQDPRIDSKCIELNLVISSTEIPNYVHERCILGKYQDKYSAWFDDGSIQIPKESLYRHATVEQLKKKS